MCIRDSPCTVGFLPGEHHNASMSGRRRKGIDARVQGRGEPKDDYPMRLEQPNDIRNRTGPHTPLVADGPSNLRNKRWIDDLFAIDWVKWHIQGREVYVLLE